MPQESDLYNIVILSLSDDSDYDESAEQLGEVCAIDTDVSAVILKKTPIILFKDVTEEEIEFARPYLEDLAEFGINFKISQHDMEGLPKANDYDKQFSIVDGKLVRNFFI